ncbi:phage major tail tube protein [Thauera butanivorans]|uniref:phage major tail tube protein n=1 Tax=Thauera butanivorans TaxID=86174 RepID=UPI000838F967|nr:phage major tail tube protein [Thauera butanivorans]
MALPRKLKNFNLFVDGESFAGVTTEVVLPKLTRKMEEYRGGGMNGPVDTDQGSEKLELEWTCGGHVRAIYQQWGASRADAVLLRFAGAYQRDDTGEVTAVEVVVRGRHSEIDPGTAKVGDEQPLKVKSSLSYYKLIEDGQVIVEIDLLNMVEVVGGVDRLEEQRRAIGL